MKPRIECRRRLCLFLALAAAPLGPARRAYSQDRVANTVHNLSVSGPGTVRAQTENRVCVFCHAPHNTGGMKPLWNRALPVTNYLIYQSSTLNANVGQPTGSSKFCLSCHDGTIALGAVLSQSEQIQMVGGDFIPSGLTNLGSDLSDDHPISFPFTSTLAAADQQLVSPSQLPADVKLSSSSEVQCTTCHNVHDDTYGNFLVKSDVYGSLCTSCHQRTGWQTCSHQSSTASMGGITGGDWPYPTVVQNACRSCHRPHSAGGHERLQIFAKEEDNCLVCHNGQVAQKNILSEIGKAFSHDPRNYLGRHDPVETQAGANPHVECTDCHNPHAAMHQTPTSTYLPIGATLAKMPGVSYGGSAVQEASFEYEVCFRCHGDSAVNVPGQITRQVQTNNLRLKFSPNNPSFHPIVQSSPSQDTVSLIPGLPSGSRIRCTDCHNNNSGPRAGGAGPDGPHGSIFNFLLERNYSTVDYTQESSSSYALCYKCHRRSSILNDESFKEHKKHIEGEDAPCFACHDPHGVPTASGSDHTHLINFDTTIVFPEPDSGKIEFQDQGRFRGSCTLLCHGEKHRNEDYKP